MTYLSLNDEGEGASYMKVTDGALSAEFRTLRLPLGTGLLGLVAQTGAPYFTSDYQNDERFVHRRFVDDAVADEGIRAILGVPLVLEGRVIGALLATHRTVRPFPPEEVSLLTSFAAHAAVALENARLFAELDEANALLREQTEAVEEAARAHDQLTGLLVHRSTLAEVVAVLTEVLGGGRVAVLDTDGRVLAGDAGPAPATGPRRGATDAVSSGHSVPVDDGYLAPALAGQEHLATVVVHGGPSARPGRAAHPRARRDRRRAGAALRPLRRRGRGAPGRGAAHRPARGQRRRPGADAATRARPAAAPRRRLRGRGRRRAGGGAAPGRPRCCPRGPGRWTAWPSSTAAARSWWCRPTTTPRVGERLRATLAEACGAPVTVGVAPVPEDPVDGGLPAAYDEARRCVETLLVLGRAGESADPAALGVTRLLLGGAGPAELADFVERTLGPVLAYDRRSAAATSSAPSRRGSRRAAAPGPARPGCTCTPTPSRSGSSGSATSWAPTGAEPDAALDLQLALRVVRLQRGVPTDA